LLLGYQGRYAEAFDGGWGFGNATAIRAVIGVPGAVDYAVAVGPTGNAIDDFGRRDDPFGLEQVTIVPLPLYYNGAEMSAHAGNYLRVWLMLERQDDHYGY
jgi:hypothetical protein